MSDILDIITSRKSVNSYTDEPVTREEIDRVLEAGKHAPSGMNKEPVIAIAVTDPEMIGKLRRMNQDVMGMYERDPFYGAPCVIAVLADKQSFTHVYDGSLAIGYMLLEAHSLGLGARWIHRCKEEFETEEGKEILRSLGIEGEYEGIGHVILGHAAGELHPDFVKKDSFAYYLD